MEKDLMNHEHRWKLRDWIPEEELSLADLILNPNAMWLLEKNIHDDNFNWDSLNKNPSAVYLLERNPDKIDWWLFSSNQSATHHILKEMKKMNFGIFHRFFSRKINWKALSLHESAIFYLEKNPHMIDWSGLSRNPSAIHLLEQNQDKIDWFHLSSNPNAIPLIEKNMDKTDWQRLCINPNAIHIIEAHLEKIEWSGWFDLCENPSAIHVLEANMLKENMDEIYMGVILETQILRNPSAIHLIKRDIVKYKQIDGFWCWLCQNPAIFELDYDFFFQRINIIRQELMAKAWHPNRFMKWCLSIDELQDLN